MDGEPWELLLEDARRGREECEVFPPTVTWQPVDGGPPVQGALTGFTGHLRADLAAGLASMRDLAGPAQWFAITMDSYARDGRGDGNGVWDGPGSLEEAFVAGDMSVMEQMVVILRWAGSRQVEMVRQVYRYTPVDGWEWDDPQFVIEPDDDVVTAVRLYG